MSFDEQSFKIVPAHFFALAFDCHFLSPEDLNRSKGELGKKFHLPKTSALCGEMHFADVAMAWNDEGLVFSVHVNQPVKYSSYPKVSEGDSVELFIDTRDVKTSGYNTRFCHHFFFLPQEVEEQVAGEITHFRGDENHPLCDEALLQVNTVHTTRGYKMQIIIPSKCLYGYDPRQFTRLGFTYRINRAQFFAQHFSASGFDYQIEQQPSLWSSARLVP